MKKILLIATILMAFNLYCFSEITIDTVWGVWDHHHDDEYGYEGLQTLSADGIDYLKETEDFMVFEKDSDGKHVIYISGRVNYIEDFYQEGNKFVFHVRYDMGHEDTMDYVIHFIDENHMWCENARISPPQKETDIMTRMPTIESLNIKEISLNEGDLMYCNDNLRLRTKPYIHDLDSKVIASMKKGTKVKVIKKGMWQGYIDNILADWVQVEVIEDSFDKDGKLLPKGTRGWCFGAYLTLLENNAK